MSHFDLICIGSGPAAIGCVQEVLKKSPEKKILIIEENAMSSGGLRNDCKMNWTFPVGFPDAYWTRESAEPFLSNARDFFVARGSEIKSKGDLSKYIQKASRLGVNLLNIEQSHLGTDGGIKLIHSIVEEFQSKGVEFLFNTKFTDYTKKDDVIEVSWTSENPGSATCSDLLIAPGRHGFETVKEVMASHNLLSNDNFIDIGVRVETSHDNYRIVDDYYDPKFIFEKHKTRTFCTNSGNARVVQEKYEGEDGETFYTVNGHAYSSETEPNGMVNFAILKSVKFTEPLASGHAFANQLANLFMLAGGGHPIYQRIEDIRLHKRSTEEGEQNFDFQPTLKSAVPGDITLCMPSKFFNAIWATLKQLDTIVPGVLNPNTILYAPEIKFYSQAPVYKDENTFMLEDHVFGCGDGFGTSRGITGAFASGVRVARGIN